MSDLIQFGVFIWFVVAIVALPFLFEGHGKVYGAEQPEWIGSVLAAVLWPTIPFALVLVALLFPVFWVIERAPGAVSNWWTKDWA